MLKRFSDFLNKDINLGIRFLILIISGVLTGLTVAFPAVGFFQWLTIIPAVLILLRRGSDKKVKLRSMYLDGLIFFYGYYLVCYHFFLSMYPLDFIEGVTKGTAAIVVTISWLGLSLLQSLMGALVFLFSALIFRGRVCQKIGVLKPIVIAALFAIFEWSQNFGWWGVPWGKLALGQTKYLVGIQNASWFGSYFITFVLVAVNCFIAYALLNITEIKVVRFCSIFALSIVVFQYSTGLIIWFTNDINQGEKVKVACVQGNISATNKLTSESMSEMEEIYLRLTREAADTGAKIIVWPETALPINLNTRIYYDMMCADIAEETQTYILVGAYSGEGESDYNSLVCYSPEGERLDVEYNKRRLVPFGEFIPMKEFFEVVIPPLTDIVINSDIVAGDSTSIMDVGGSQVGCLICFDSIYDYLTLDTVRDGAEIICLSTNDSWFSGSPALSIHRSHSQLRAIESGRYITRCASTGISSIVSPRGEILSYIAEDTEGIIVYEICERNNKTVWHYIGNMFIYICLTFSAALLTERVVSGIKNRRTKKQIDEKVS
ncbi:MAG: apolipoprotein N-acyltransferase [Ruminococcaceae bacterium]|nr:apolipoprotein N-acyltransferase [Oscillospiraceae bacterium]